MTGKDLFKIWAKPGCKWVDWVRPVPFVAIDSEDFELYNSTNYIKPNVDYTEELDGSDIAIIVDLPGYRSIEEGISLAQKGYRPIPLYNGTKEPKGAMPTVDNQEIEEALIWGTYELEKIELKNEALPAFLLDTNRMNRYKMSLSVFDNSWDIYHQDIPTAEYFLKNGIKRIAIRTERIQKDLKTIFYKFQKKGIKFYQIKNNYEIKEVKFKRQ